MLVIFSSTATGDVMMFGDIARRLLRLMGQTGNIPGGITAEHIPAALQRLHEALEETTEEADKAPDEDDKDRAPRVGLAVRAYPLIEMLKAAVAEDTSVMWRQKT